MTDAEQMLRKLINQIVEKEGLQEYNVALQPISSGGANYTSQLFVVNVTGDKELRLFAKVAILGEKMREAVPMGVFDTERYFYTKLLKTYEELEDKFNVLEEHKLACPKFYGCNSNYLEETIVLDNLVHQGYGDYNRLDSVDWPYAASAVTEIAKLHALSYACKRQNPNEFANIIESLKFEWNMTDEQHATLWGSNKKLAIDATDIKNRERVENYLKESINFSLEDFLRPIDAVVLIHGDYRASNLLHKYNENGTVSIKIVDFQTIQGGCPTADFVYFIISSTDEEFRGHYFHKLVEHYYEELCAALKRLDISPDEVYPRKMFDDELKEKLRFAFHLAVFALPIVTVETKNAPVIDLDSDFSNFVVEKTSDLYPKRLNGIINDCIRWGVL